MGSADMMSGSAGLNTVVLPCKWDGTRRGMMKQDETFDTKKENSIVRDVAIKPTVVDTLTAAATGGGGCRTGGGAACR